LHKTDFSTLLILASEPEWVALLDKLLAEQSESVWLVVASSWGEARRQLRGNKPDLLFATPECLPSTVECSLPAILLVESAPLQLPEGVSDWLQADTLTAEVLRRCVRYSKQTRAIRRQATLDPLTGIANRQTFQTTLQHRLEVAGGRGLLLGYLDLDDFKHANKSLGHYFGDKLIVQVVERLQAILKPEDFLGRAGSDEFILLLDLNDSAARAESVVQALMAALAEPYWIEGESLTLGASLGLAYARATGSADTLLWHAHVAMQQAKSHKGCSHHLYDERISRGAHLQADLEAELRRALRRDELEMHYQPRLDLATGEVVGVEALVRWRHPERGLLYPMDFIPLAEQSGLIVPLGYWIIARALHDARTLDMRGMCLHMAINLSFSQFQDSQLLPTVERLIAASGVDARRLEFEFTETAVIQRGDFVLRTMKALRALGVRFSLDDFGTGFSSFAHLASLPIALLKLDKSFVTGMHERTEQYRLVSAMVSLAGNLGLEMVAEGVEHEDELALLKELGCDLVQGYLISKPVPLKQLAEFIELGRQGQHPLLAAVG
jgi:diguanylate cyclase (GGDEF)-like protein